MRQTCCILRQISQRGYGHGMNESLVHAAPVSFSAHLGDGHLTQGFDVSVVSNALPHVRMRHLSMRAWSFSVL